MCVFIYCFVWPTVRNLNYSVHTMKQIEICTNVKLEPVHPNTQLQPTTAACWQRERNWASMFEESKLQDMMVKLYSLQSLCDANEKVRNYFTNATYLRTGAVFSRRRLSGSLRVNVLDQLSELVHIAFVLVQHHKKTEPDMLTSAGFSRTCPPF